MPYVEPVMKSLTWPQVVLILGLSLMLMTSVTWLALAGRDVAAIYGAVGTVVLAIAAAFGVNIHNKLGEVKDVANGRLTEALEQQRILQRQVTAMALQVPTREDKEEQQ